MRFHAYGSRYLCRLHSTEGGPCVHTHTHPAFTPEPYPSDTFNYPANSKCIICHHLQVFFLLVSLCDNDLHMDRVQTIWTMSDSRLKSSSQRNWSSVATTKHQERGVFPAVPQPRPRPAQRPMPSGCVLFQAVLGWPKPPASLGRRAGAGRMKFQQGPAL